MLAERALAWLLRAIGGVTVLAVLAALLPTDWMAATHAWLGLGRFPRAPIVEYLTRSISLLYTLHGGVFLVASTDVRRYAPLITYLGIANAAGGVVLLAIDAFAAMPWYWTAAEGPLIIAASAAVLWLNHRVQHPARCGAGQSSSAAGA